MGSKVETLKNKFQHWSGRFVVPELPVAMGPRIQAEKTKTQKNITARYPTLLSAERSALGEKGRKKMLSCLALAFLWPKTSKDHSATKHYKTRGFVVFVLCFLSSVCPKQEQQQSKQKQASTTKQQPWDPEIKQNKKNKKHKKKTMTPNQQTTDIIN